MGSEQPAGNSGMAIASLVLGLVGIPLCMCFIPSLLAIIFGAIGLNQIKQNPRLGGRGMAIAGLVLGIVFLVVSIPFWFMAGWTLRAGMTPATNRPSAGPRCAAPPTGVVWKVDEDTTTEV